MMVLSTPNSKDLRRMSIMNSSATYSGKTPGRRSLMTPKVMVAVLQNSPSDDEAERNNRRNTVSMQRRLSSLAPSNASPFTEISNITNEAELKDHLKICTKLYTENKISTKNAWELHIIDIIRKITSTESANVLQVAGSSLDIGAKVYALRVDDVHTRGLKLASTMSRTSENQSQQDTDERDEAPGEETDGRRKAVSKKKKKGLRGDKKNTIDKEGKTLSAPLKEMETVLFSTKDNIEVSATDNLFTHKLHLNPATHQFMLMSQEKHWVTSPDLQLEEDDVVQIDLVHITAASICQAFNDFEFGEWSPNEEDKQLINASIAPEVVLDDNGVPIPELDGSLPNIFNNFNEGDGGGEDPESDVEEHAEFQAQIHGEIAHIVDTIPEEELVRTDYGFNAVIRTTSGKFFDKIWAGPFHWKVKFNRRSCSRFSGKTDHVAKQTKKIKVQQPVDLASVTVDLKNVKKHVVKRTRATTASEKITLPVPEISYEIYHENTDALLTKPAVKCTNRAPQEARVSEVGAYNYENPNDSQYCSQHNTDDGHDGEPIHNSFEEEVPPAALQNLMGENLVDAPETVAATQMAYALHAKKMDMKKLKSAIWKRLTEGSKNANQIIPLRFSQLYKEIPNYISDDMKKELSSPLAFVALLHLCNENELFLQQDPSYKDFTVTKAKK